METTICYDVLCRVAEFNGEPVPCIFIPAYPTNRGNIACFDNEGLNEASLGYLRGTKPAKRPEHVDACNALIARFNAIGEPSTARIVKRVNRDTLRQQWKGA